MLKLLKNNQLILKNQKLLKNSFSEKIIKNKIPAETITSGVLAEKTNCDKNIDLDNFEDDKCFNKDNYFTVGLCFGCGKNLSEVSKGIDCTFCSRFYHLTCLKKEEYCDLGDDKSWLFICKPFNKN